MNLGSLGFLTDIAPQELTTSLTSILKGDYYLEERFFLEAKVNKTKSINLALNEVVVHSREVAQLIEYELFIDGVFVYRQKADGIIVNTPTGSTGYSLSGNGPIIHPSVNAITLLPMFPHSLNTRPLLVDEASEILLKIGNKGKASLSLDSHNYLTLKAGDSIKIVDSSGSSANLNDDYGNGYGRIAYAIEANSSGYLLAIKSTDNWGGSSEDNVYWDVYQLTTQTSSGVTTAIYDWTPVFSSEDISSYEVTFKQDLNEDGTTGRDTSNITIKALPFDLL